MYKKFRVLHKWIGVLCCLFLMVIAATGFLLALKAKFGWMRPPSVQGSEVKDYMHTMSPGAAMEQAFELGYPNLKTPKDVDRVDYRPKQNMFKVIAKEGYLEVQVDGQNGRILQVSDRNDQLVEDIHDLSFVADWAREWVLPVVAAGLFFLGLSGLVMYLVPVFRRAKYNKTQKAN